jgi:DNA-binding HxlR family transcriptional regulator
MGDHEFGGNVFLSDCPARTAVEVIADKWSVVTLYGLMAGPLRHGELVEAIGGISKKMLTQTLRRLERNGLVIRTAYAEVPPRVEYELTDLGMSLRETIQTLTRWAETHGLELDDAAEAADARSSSPAISRAGLEPA